MQVTRQTLNPNAEVICIDEMNAEDAAMMQALKSRSAESVLVHLEKLKKAGSGKFMDKYYVGYGHKSIGDCGDVDLYFEGVSCFVAKAIQDNPLYRGQECSTRYLDFSKGLAYNPAPRLDVAGECLGNLFSLYRALLPKQVEYVMAKFPRGRDMGEEQWERACRAKSFDVLRGFLPTGVLTNVSWSSDIRQLNDHLQLLSHHPMEEVKSVTKNTLKLLSTNYPSSFSHKKYPEVEAFIANNSHSFHYARGGNCVNNPQGFITMLSDTLDWHGISADFGRVINTRPVRAPLPKALEHYGQVVFDFTMDFGSFRDIQRHRKSIIPMPLLHQDSRFEQWYVDNLNPDLVEMVQAALARQWHYVHEASSHIDDVELQYLLPMGTLGRSRISCTLPQLVYIIELRTSQHVHPTVRTLAHALYRYIRHFTSLKIAADLDPDQWSLARGQDTIIEKG